MTIQTGHKNDGALIKRQILIIFEKLINVIW